MDEVWDCNPGQGELDKWKIELNGFGEVTVDHLDSCKNQCLKQTGCSGIDYSNTNSHETKPSCRMYGQHNIRPDGGPDQRVYCELGKME